MIGSKYIEIDWRNFVQGMSTSNTTTDGGFSIGPNSSAPSVINPIATPGILNFPAAAVDKSTNLSGSIIASCEDPSGTYDLLYLTDSGKFYGWNGTTLSSAIATDATRSYTPGKTDMVGYGPYAYGTSNTHVWEWVVTTATINQTYFSFASSSGSASWTAANVPHPCIVYEGNVYYGNGPQLLRQTTVGGTPAEVLLLPNYGEVIVSLGIDPGSGKILISTSSGINLSGTLSKLNKVHYYNGYSDKVDKVVITEEMITCFYNNGGTVFVGCGQNFGYWTGTGVQFLRKLDIGLDNTQLLYKHHITDIGNILYIVEKSRILAFGEVMQGQGRSWWYALRNGSTNISMISNIGSNKLGYSYATSKFYTFDVTSTADLGTAKFVSFEYSFPRAVTFNAVEVEYATALTASTQTGIVYINDDRGNSNQIATVETPESNLTVYPCTNPTIKTQVMQVEYAPQVNKGIKKFRIFYNDKE